MQSSDIPYKFVRAWAEVAGSGYITNPIPETATGGAASQDEGFPPITAQPTGAGGIPPDIADFNGAFSYFSLWARWLQAGGAIVYDATFSAAIGGYPGGTVLRSSVAANIFWLSTADDNTTDPDGGSPANWANIYISMNIPGDPTTTTQAVNDQSTRIATTAFVNRGSNLVVNPGYRRNADGTVEQWWSAVVPAGSGLTTTTVSIPIAYLTDVVDVGICFIGNTPPGANDPGSISIDFLTISAVSVTTNYTNAGTSLGVRIRTLGY